MKYVLPFALFLSLSSTASAQEIGVKVSVGGNFGIKEQVTSKLNKYFRQFKDVVLADEGHYFEVAVGVLAVKLGDETIVYAMSVVVLEPIDGTDAAIFKEKCPQGSAAFDMYVGQKLLSDLYFYTVPPDKLDAQCQAVVETIDSRVLEPLRKARQEKIRN